MEAAATKTTEEMEGEISRAMRARVKDFKEQADSLTLEGVRRALEKDLGMEKFSLDAQKKFIKQCLNECFMATDDDSESRTLETATKADQPEKEASIQHEGLKTSESVGPALNEIELAGENEESQHVEDDSDLSEDKIRKALKKRAAYVRDNLENISLAEVRRLLEGDLNLEKNALDTYKGFIKKELDAALMSAEPLETTNWTKKRKKVSSPTKETSRDSDSLDSNDDISNDEEADEERKPKKRLAQKNKSSTKRIINDKKTMVESKSSSARKKKPVDQDSDKCSESDDEKSSEGNHSNSSADESVKKKIEKPTQVYGKKVEHLKSIIRSCGLGIPPSIYKKVKQAPESKREAFLIKELQEILEREGLSTNPSEKEIKAVKKKKDRAKELEGIDMSNIVMSSRRRATSNYIPPPKPKVEVESEDEEEEEDEDNEDDEEDTDGDNDGGNSSEGSEDGEEESD